MSYHIVYLERHGKIITQKWEQNFLHNIANGKLKEDVLHHEEIKTEDEKRSLEQLERLYPYAN